MNYQISNDNISLIASYKPDIKAFLLLILSIVFIPAAYIFVAAVFIAGLIKKHENLNLNKMSLLIYAYVAIGLLASEYKIISGFFALLMLMCHYSYLLYKSLDAQSMTKIKNCVFAVSLIVFIIGIMQYFNSDFAIPSKWVDSNEFSISKRIYSTFFNPNVFGFYINLILITSIDNLNFKKANLESVVFISGVICLVLTFSRTAWVSLIASLVVASLFNKKYFKYAVMISLVIWIFDAYLGVERINPSKALEDSSFLYRIEVWKTSLQIIKNNPLFGIGFGTLHKYVAEYSPIISTTIEHNHNIYIQIATETGIVGFSIFLGLLVKVLNYFKNNLFKINNKNYIAVFCVFIMTMIHGLVDSVAFTPQILMILCIYAGTVSSRINN